MRVEGVQAQVLRALWTIPAAVHWVTHHLTVQSPVSAIRMKERFGVGLPSEPVIPPG